MRDDDARPGMLGLARSQADCEADLNDESGAAGLSQKCRILPCLGDIERALAVLAILGLTDETTPPITGWAH